MAPISRGLFKNGHKSLGDYILIVDDDPDAREILDLVLGTLELPTMLATNGDEAVIQINKYPPLLVTLDLSMPKLDGKGVLKALRADPNLAQIPILIFTAGIVNQELATDLNVPLHHVIRKGTMSMTLLRDVVIQILGPKIKIDESATH